MIGPDTCVWLWDIDSDSLPDMAQSLLALGYAPDAWAHTQASWDQLIHVDDLADLEAAYQRHACGQTDLHECHYRVRHANGQWHWLVERGRIVERHADGRPRRMVGTLTDITLRREADAAGSTPSETWAGAQSIPGAPPALTGRGMRITLGTGSPARRRALIHCISPPITSRCVRAGHLTRRRGPIPLRDSR